MQAAPNVVRMSPMHSCSFGILRIGPREHLDAADDNFPADQQGCPRELPLPAGV
jgi:hypothetical protein